MGSLWGKIVNLGCVQVTETFSVTRKTKANFPFSCDSFSVEDSEHPQTILKLSFGTTKMAVCANKISVYLFVTKEPKIWECFLRL